MKSGFKSFMLKLDAMKYPAVSADLWIKYLRTGGMEVVALGRGGIDEARLEDYVVSGLVDFDDVSYDVHADLLYDLATQTVRHLQSYLSEDETRKVLRSYRTMQLPRICPWMGLPLATAGSNESDVFFR